MKRQFLLPIPDALLGVTTLIVIPVLLALVLLLSSCAAPLGLPGGLQSSLVPQKRSTIAYPIIVPFKPFTVVQACLDITSSYPYADFKKAEGKIADAIDQAVVPNSNGLTAYVNLITSNSWTDDSTIFTDHINAIPADPAAPTLEKAPASSGNVFMDKQAQKIVQKNNQAAVASFQAHLSASHAALKQLEQQTQSRTNALRAYTIAETSLGTDIYGCLERAAARMQGVQGNKLLLVASDLQNNLSTEDSGSLNLSGVRVAVIYHYCNDVATCQSANTWFARLIRGAKASAVNFYDVAQSDNLLNVFNA